MVFKFCAPFEWQDLGLNQDNRNTMHICLLSYRGNMYCGGQGIYLYYLSKALAEAGHRVTVIVSPPYPDPMPWAKVYQINNENFYARSYPYFLPKQNPLEIFSPLNFLEFASTRMRMFPEMLSFSLRAFGLLQAINEKEHFDIIHDNQCLGYGLLLMKRLGIPVVATIHHPLAIDRMAALEQARSFSERWKRLMYYPWIMQKLVAQRLNDIITVSDSAAMEIEKAFTIPASRIKVVYNGVDTNLFRPKNNENCREFRNKLIFVGNTEDRKKGIIYLLKALQILPEELQLTIVSGLAPKHGYANTLVESFGLGKRVHFAGRVSNSTLRDYYQQADLAVVPSVYEGFGFPAAEAMSCGLPVVATKGGALPEVLGDQGCGILVEPKNDQTLAEAIRTIMENVSIRMEMGTKGRERILQNFTWKAVAESMVRVYQENIDVLRSR